MVVLIVMMQRELDLDRVGPHCYEHLLTALAGERIGEDPALIDGQVKEFLSGAHTIELMMNSFMVLSKGNSRADLLIADAIRLIETRNRAPLA